MPESHHIVVNDKIKKKSEHIIKVYSMNQGRLRLDKTIKAPCQHELAELLGLMVCQQELLAISCRECKTIRLMNIGLDTEPVTEAFGGERVDYMCQGEEGRMFVRLIGSDKVLELDCSSSRYTHKNTIHTGLLFCDGLCYVSGHDYLVICGHREFLSKNKIRALSCRDGSIVWRVERGFEGRQIDPQGLLSYKDVILVAESRRIVVLDPSDGSCIQIINLPKLGEILKLGLCKHNIGVFHRVDDKDKISFFDIE